MKTLSIILMLLLSVSCAFAQQKPKVVAVIDTGFKFSEKTKGARLCKFGHKDFTAEKQFQVGFTSTPVPTDNHGHGTNIAGLIQRHAENANFCIVVLKYYDPKASGEKNLASSIAAISYATSIRADYINYSGGGPVNDPEEARAIKYYLNRGGKIVAAAGNERSNIQIRPFYPAMTDPRVISVGSTDEFGNRLPSSNYGFGIVKWEIGYKQEGFGITLTGTSQAAAITMGKLIKKECAK